jgi:hypothetical protein
VKQLEKGDAIELYVSDGRIRATVTETEALK